MAQIDGEVAPGWEGVRAAFGANFDQHGDVGASTAVYHRGQKVVDLWGGVTRPGGPAYTDETLQLVFSSTKGATATCAAILVDRGELDVEAPVREYWPEFADAGKNDMPVRLLLTHESGLYDIDGEMTLDEALKWDPVIAALAAQKPLWELGAQHGYHAVTYGYLVGEIIKRISGRSIGRFLAEEVVAPLDLDLWIGLPDEQQRRVAPILPWERPEIPEVAAMMEQLMGPGSILGRALAAPGGAFRTAELGDGADLDSFVFNQPEIRAAEIPAANGVTNARSLARMYAAVIGEVDGVQLMKPEVRADFGRQRTEGVDTILMFMDVQFGLGYMKPSSLLVLGGPDSIGHYGAGGSVGFADPAAELSFAYVMNRMDIGLAGDPRSADLIAATYQAAS